MIAAALETVKLKKSKLYFADKTELSSQKIRKGAFCRGAGGIVTNIK